MTLSERDHLAFARVDEALRSYPLAEAPPKLTSAVLARVRAQTLAARPRFQVPWIDYAISIFATGMAALVFIIWRFVPPQTLYYFFVRLRLEALIISRQVNLTLIVPALTVSAVLVLAALVVAAWDLSRLRLSPDR